MSVIRQLLNVPSTDPDNQRRARLLNILLIGMTVLVLLALLAAIASQITGLDTAEAVLPVYLGVVIMLVGIIFLFFINRHGSTFLASTLFLLLLTGILAFVDKPQEVANGRSLFMLAMPILMASVLLRPSASFAMAFVIDLVITGLAIYADVVPNPYAMIGFFVMAMVSWLSARSLERALEELRAINRELDQRVEERTRDLAAALAREQAEANKNQAILEGIADGVIVFDKAGRSIVANPAISQLIERPAEKIIGYEIKDLMAGRVADQDQETLTNLLQEKESHAPSVRLDWGKKTLSVSVAPVNAAKDGVSGTVVVFRDYTREAEVERMKSAFVSMVSHDLRTPLSAITGYTDMLREAVYGPLSEAQLGVMERINSSTGRLLNMVNNLLDQAQIETGKLSLRVNSFDPQDLIAEMEAVMRVLAENKGIELVSSIDEQVPSSLSGDQQRLHQILVNLVNNAIKFTDQGRVTVRLYRPEDDHWAMDVADTGPGIPPDAQAYIFESFRRVDSATTRQKSGVGLGLSIVKQLTAAMGGEVKLASEVGQGSTFTVVMPIVPVQEDIA